MVTTSKTALFFILATLSLAKYEAEISALSRQRHPLLAPLADLSLSVEETKRKIADDLNAVLHFAPEQATPNFWQGLMAQPADFEYKFQEGEEDLNEDTVKSRMADFIDQSFPSLDSLASLEGEEAITKAYFAGMDQIYAKLDRLLKMELVTQFVKINREGSGKLKFLGTIAAKVQDKITTKANQLIAAKQIRPTAALQQVKTQLEHIESAIKGDYFARIQSVADLYANKMIYFNVETQLLIILAQVQSDVKKANVIAKFEYVLTSLAEFAMIAENKDVILDLFSKFSDCITASRAGSSLGSLRFKEMIPSIIGIYIRIAGTHFGHDNGYNIARKYFRSIGRVSTGAGIRSWFESYVLDGANLPHVGDPSADDFKKNAIKAVDIINNVDYSKNLLMWWMQAQKSMVDILEVVGAGTLQQTNYYKMITSESPLKYAPNAEYFKGVYDLLVDFLVEKDAETGGRSGWHIRFMDYLNEQFATNAFVKKYYLWVKVHVLAYRETNDGETQMVEFIKGNESNWDSFRNWAVGLSKEIHDQYFGSLVMVYKKVGNKLTGPDRFAMKKYPEFLAGKKLPLTAFMQVAIQTVVDEKEIEDKETDLEKRRIETEIKEGRAKQDLDELKKKQPSPVKETVQPVQEVQQTEPVQNNVPLLVNQEELVVKEPTPVKHNTPIKEPTPVREKELTPVVEKQQSPVKQIDEGLREETPNKITPIILPQEQDQDQPLKDLDEDKKSNEPKILEPIVNPSEVNEQQVNEPEVIQPEVIQPKNNEPVITEPVNPQTNDGEKDNRPDVQEQPEQEPELENLIDVVKGNLDATTIEALRRSPDLVDLVEKIQIVVDPETGDETHYHYIQVVPKDSACYESISE